MKSPVHYIMLLMLMTMLSACNKFSFSAMAEKMETGLEIDPIEPLEPEPFCGDENTPQEQWFMTGTTLVDCPDLCSDGTQLKCHAELEEKFVCVHGVMSKNGEQRIRDVLSPIEACPILPGSCGEHVSGSTWWNETGSAQKNCDVCSDGSPRLCDVAIESENLCQNGVSSLTGQDRDGRVISYLNECLPSAPQSCGNEAHGSLWWLESGVLTEACQSCADGSTLNCEYAREIQRTCHNGATSDTGSNRKGRLIRTIGSCPLLPPKSCGDVPHGGFTWPETGVGSAKICETCPDGSPHYCQRAIESQLVCSNGQLNMTGQTREGRLIGYTNQCPVGSEAGAETFTVAHGSGQVDVLIILDTTGSMDRNLDKLGKRFKNLISAWSGLNWQIAMTNADVGTGFVNGWSMRGRPMILQGDTRQRRLLTSGMPWAEDFFLKTIAREPFDSYCDLQPYCMGGKPEPLKTFMTAINERQHEYYRGFWRRGAHLATIFISDADENEKGPLDAKATTPETAWNHYQRTLGTSYNSGYSHYSIVIPPGDKACLDYENGLFKGGRGGAYGTYADRYAKLVGGTTVRICDTDFAAPLSKLSEEVRQEVTKLTLKHLPLPGSFSLTLTPAFNVQYVLRGKEVLFSKPVPVGTKIEVKYNYKK